MVFWHSRKLQWIWPTYSLVSIGGVTRRYDNGCHLCTLSQVLTGIPGTMTFSHCNAILQPFIQNATGWPAQDQMQLNCCHSRQFDQSTCQLASNNPTSPDSFRQGTIHIQQHTIVHQCHRQLAFNTQSFAQKKLQHIQMWFTQVEAAPIHMKQISLPMNIVYIMSSALQKGWWVVVEMRAWNKYQITAYGESLMTPCLHLQFDTSFCVWSMSVTEVLDQCFMLSTQTDLRHLL